MFCTVGIGDNPLLAKLALDIESKHNSNFRGEWTYQDVQSKVWPIEPLSEFWGIGSRTEKKLHLRWIRSIGDLANYDPYLLKSAMGVMGLQLWFHANGIDRTDISTPPPKTKEKSYGNSQVLPKDYIDKGEIEIVVKEMAEQVATRIRKHGCKTECVHLMIGTSIAETKKGFSHQMKIPPTSDTKELQHYCLHLFRKYYEDQEVRHVGVTYSKLVHTDALQLDLFQDPTNQIINDNLDKIIDRIRGKYGFTSIVRASSLIDGARSIKRSSLVGGHAGGNGGMMSDIPDYQDRGLLKWLGFYLSDHTEKIDKEKELSKNVNIAKSQMESNKIQEILAQSALKRLPVSIQKEERDLEGYYPDDIVGLIDGGDELGLYISGQKVGYDEIRHIELLDWHKWSELR